MTPFDNGNPSPVGDVDLHEVSTDGGKQIVEGAGRGAPDAPVALAPPVQLAAASTSGQLVEIGSVDKVQGGARALHSDGISAGLALGSPVYQGDTVETSADGTIGIIFLDGTTFTLGGNAKMVLNELVYDPAAQSGSSVMSVVQGTFVFVTGQVASTGPDAMKVHTPAGTIGIRGTKVGCVVDIGTGAVTCVNLEVEGHVGVFAFSNNAGVTLVGDENQAIVVFDPFSQPITSILTDDEVESLLGFVLATEAGPLFLMSSGAVLVEPGGGTAFDGLTSSTPLTQEEFEEIFLAATSDSGETRSFLQASLGSASTPDPVEHGSTTGTLNIVSDAAAPGTASFTGVSGVSAANLTSGGNPVAVQQVSPTQWQGVFAADPGTVVFMLTITDPTTGAFTFDIWEPLDHALDSGLITFTFGVEITNIFQESIVTSIVVQIVDTVPTAVADSPLILQEGAEVAAFAGVNLLANDNIGADVPPGEGSLQVISIAYNGGAAEVPEGDSVTVVTDLGGTLTVFSNGNWEYTPPANVAGTSDDSFTYTIIDFDGDEASALQQITIAEDTTAEAPDAAAAGASEAVLDEGSSPSEPDQSVDGNVAIDFGTDQPFVQIVDIADPVISDPENGFLGALTSLGRPLRFEQTDLGGGERSIMALVDGGPDDGLKILELSLDADGNFTFTLSGVLDHPDAGETGPLDPLLLSFDYTASDGVDSAIGTINITVQDDAPVAVDDANNANEGGLAVGGNVITENDTPGADGVTVTEVNGIPISGQTEIVGNAGTLSIDETGAYTYTPFATSLVTSDSFDYTIVDGDGDSAAATLTVGIADTNTPVVGDLTDMVDEAALATGSNPGSAAETTSGTLNFDFGGDGGGGVSSFTNDSAATVDNGDRWTITGSFWTIEVIKETGAYTFTLTGNTTGHAGPGLVGADDLVTMVFSFEATDADGSAVPGGSLTIEVKDDGPLASEGPVMDVLETSTTGDATDLLNGTNLLANDTAGADGIRVSEISYEGAGGPAVAAVPDGGSVAVTTALGAVLTVHSDGVWTYDPPANVDGTSTDDFSYEITDGDGDTATASQQITIFEDGTAVAGDGGDTVREAALAAGSDPASPDESTGGVVTIDFGEDQGAVAITAISDPVIADLDGAFAGPLTSEGRSLRFEESDLGGGSREIAGVVDGGADDGTVIFTLTLAPNGVWSFDLQGVLDHPDAGVNGAEIGVSDVLQLAFTYTAAEDVDSAQGVITVTVEDDGPSIVSDGDVMVDEADLPGSSSIAVSFTVDNGADDAGAGIADVALLMTEDGDDGGVVALETTDGTAVLTFYDVGTQTLIGYTGADPGILANRVFTLQVDDNGGGTFTLLRSLNHPDVDETDAADPLDLSFRVTLTDGDADTATADITVTVKDDGPLASADVNAAVEGNAVPVIGNVVGGPDASTGDVADAAGEDGATVTAINFLNTSEVLQTVAVPQDGSSVTVETFMGGMLAIDMTGLYSYLAPPPGSISVDTDDVFTYTLTDGDGDSVPADLTIGVEAVAERLTGQITSNAPAKDQVLLLTLVSLTDPSKFFQFVIDTTSGGQAAENVILIDEDTGFTIGEDQFVLTIEYINGTNQFQITDIEIGGVTLFPNADATATNVSGNIKLGFDANEDEAVVMAFTPSDGTAPVTGPYVTDGTALTVDAGDGTFNIGADSVTPDNPAAAAEPNIMTGGTGNDTLTGGAEADYLFGEQGNDVLTGNGGNDLLSGGTGADTLLGGFAGDVLVGGPGLDTLTGGPDADTFKYFRIEDGGAGETITDFSMVEGDVLDIHEILVGFDPDTSVLSQFVSTASGGGDTVVSIDTDGPGAGAAMTPLVTLQSLTIDLAGLDDNLILV